MVHDSMVRDSNKLPMTSSKVTVHCHGAKAMMMNDNTVVSFMYQLLSTLHLIKEKTICTFGLHAKRVPIYNIPIIYDVYGTQNIYPTNAPRVQVFALSYVSFRFATAIISAWQ